MRRPAKPCKTCGHAKAKHRAGRCLHQWRVRVRPFMGVGVSVKDCGCDGYVERGDTR